MLDHDKAMKLWNSVLGKSVTRARDYRNRLIYKEAYGQPNSEFGWEVHHILPKNQGGTDAFDNLQIVHYLTHNEIHGRQ
jgi:5-methylcytosine-specific restriction endonuclease McrA